MPIYAFFYSTDLQKTQESNPLRSCPKYSTTPFIDFFYKKNEKEKKKKIDIPTVSPISKPLEKLISQKATQRTTLSPISTDEAHSLRRQELKEKEMLSSGME